MRLFLLALIFLFSSSCFGGDFLKVLYVADHLTTCDTGTCLLTRNSPDEPWKPFSERIEGFKYSAGFEYCILVKVIKVTTEPGETDSARFRYVLSEIKTKLKKGNSTIRTKPEYVPDSSRWTLYKLKTKDGTKTFSVGKAWIQFGLPDEKLIGTTGCNTFEATFSIDTSRFEFLNIDITKSACGKHSIEHDLLEAFHQTNHYKVSSNLFYLFRDKYLLALFTLKK